MAKKTIIGLTESIKITGKKKVKKIVARKGLQMNWD